MELGQQVTAPPSSGVANTSGVNDQMWTLSVLKYGADWTDIKWSTFCFTFKDIWKPKWILSKQAFIMILYPPGACNDFGLLPLALTSPPSGHYVMALHVSWRYIADYIFLEVYSQVWLLIFLSYHWELSCTDKFIAKGFLCMNTCPNCGNQLIKFVHNHLDNCGTSSL